MFHRAELILVELVLGAVLAALSARALSGPAVDRLPRSYLLAMSAVIAARALAFATGRVVGFGSVLGAALAATTDLANLLVGALAGLVIAGARRPALRPAVRAPEVEYAVRLSAAVWFALYAFGNLGARSEMIAFFTQAGYPAWMFSLTNSAELLAALALLVPWRWLMLAATLGLTVDMVAAVATHLHNGDPMSDSVDALSMLARLAALTALSVRDRTATARPIDL